MMWHETPRLWGAEAVKAMITQSEFFAATKWLIRGTFFLWILWDLIADGLFGHEATISHAMWLWSLEYPWFSISVILVLAILCWHFFVGNAIGAGITRLRAYWRRGRKTRKDRIDSLFDDRD